MVKKKRIQWTKIPWIRAENLDAPEGACVDEWCVTWYTRISVYPSVREVFYEGVDVYWPNTTSSYKTMDKWLTKLREDGRFPVHYLRDGGKRGSTSPEYGATDPDEYVDGEVDTLRVMILDMLSGNHYYRLCRWEKQPYKLFVVIEKEGDRAHLQHICGPLGVSVSYSKGFSSVPLHKELAEQMMRATAEGRINILLYVGDFDPSGQKIRQSFTEKLRHWGAMFEEPILVAVTKQQVQAFNLPCHPDNIEELAKLERQHGAADWIATHGKIRVETSAFRSREPDAFEQLVRDAIRPYFSEAIHEQVQQLALARKTWIEYRLRQFKNPKYLSKWIGEVIEDAVSDDPSEDPSDPAW